MIGSIVIGKI